jgi:hypothetical protein
VPNVRRSQLNSESGPMEVKTYTLHKLFMHHPAFNLVGYKCYFVI